MLAYTDVPVHIVVVQVPDPNVGVPWKPALHAHVPALPVASPVQVATLSVTRSVLVIAYPTAAAVHSSFVGASTAHVPVVEVAHPV